MPSRVIFQEGLKACALTHVPLRLAFIALACVTAFQAQAFTAYVSNEKGNSISVIDTDKMEVTETILVGHRPRGIALSHDGGQLSFALATKI